MTTAPTWWWWISGLFFLMNLVLFGALAFAAIKVAGLLQDLTPRIAAIEKSVQELVKKVQDLTTNINETVNTVGGRAKSVVGSAEGIAHSATRQFERYSPLVIGALTAIRIVKAVSDAKNDRSAANKRKALVKKPAGLIKSLVKMIRR